MTICADQYSACLGGVEPAVLGGTQCCASQYQACLCDCPTDNADTGNPGPGCPGCSLDSPAVGDPVDATSGLFLYDHTDLELKDVMPIELSRSYRELDEQNRAFGIGMALGYDLTIIVDERTSAVAYDGNSYTVPNYAYADLILPNGRRVYYARVSPGNYFEGAQFQNTNFPGEYFGSTLTASGSGWVLQAQRRHQDGFRKPLAADLNHNRNGNQIEILRDFNNLFAPRGHFSQRPLDLLHPRLKQPHNAGTGQRRSHRFIQLQFQWSSETLHRCERWLTSYAYDSSGRMYTITDREGTYSSRTTSTIRATE